MEVQPGLSVNWAIPPGSKWDMNIVESVLSGRWMTMRRKPRNGPILVLPGADYAGRPLEVQTMLKGDPLLIVTSDESRRFPATYPHILVQTPKLDELEFGFPLGPPPTGLREPLVGRPWLWTFLGQVTHSRRRELADALEGHADGFLLTTDRFASGWSRPRYLEAMSRGVWAPCPSGPATVDTFRFYEAIILGCAPIVDRYTPSTDMTAYFEGLVDVKGGDLAWLGNWGNAHDLMRNELSRWRYWAAQAAGWWGNAYKRFSDKIEDDLVSRFGRDNHLDDEDIGVVITSSHVPSHPSTAMIREVVNSVRALLPNAPIRIACDYSEDQDYQGYLYRLTRLANTEWMNVTVTIQRSHGHQIGSVEQALSDPYWPPFTLMMEHDTPLVGPIPFDDLASIIRKDQLDVIRFHHETHVLDVHQHLMFGEPKEYDGCFTDRRLWPTMQWSQRPHLASTAYYRKILAKHLHGQHNYVEEIMHSVCQREPWTRNRLAIYHEPLGALGIKRSGHLDGKVYAG